MDIAELNRFYIVKMTDPQVYMYVSNLQNQSDFRVLFSKRINRSLVRDYNYTCYYLFFILISK